MGKVLILIFGSATDSPRLAKYVVVPDRPNENKLLHRKFRRDTRRAGMPGEGKSGRTKGGAKTSVVHNQKTLCLKIIPANAVIRQDNVKIMAAVDIDQVPLPGRDVLHSRAVRGKRPD